VALKDGIVAVPEASDEMRRLFAQLEEPPLWLDWNQLDRGGAVHRRCSVAGGLVLACCALPLIYASRGANKPLVFTGQLVNRAERRLSETAKFMHSTCARGGLRVRAEGWQITVKVRLMHAMMRRHLLHPSRNWDTSVWGMPANQVDLIATNLHFSVSLLDNMRRIGFQFTSADAEAVMHLWRYSGYLLGIDPELLCATEAEGRNRSALIALTQEPPDDDAHRLTKALMEQALPGFLLSQKPNPDDRLPWVSRFCYGLSYSLLGKRIAESLGYRRSTWRFTARPLLWTLITPIEVLRRLVPGGTWLAVYLGSTLVERLLASNRAAKDARFRLPKKPEEDDDE
jgi:hypothetical protein